MTSQTTAFASTSANEPFARAIPIFMPVRAIPDRWLIQCLSQVCVVRATWTSNPAFVILHRQVVNGVATVSSSIEQLGYDANFAPRVSFGVSSASELLGFRTTWWHFDERSHQRGVINSDPTLNTLVSTPEIFG